MHPILLQFDNFTIHSYGFFIAVGFLVCLFLMRSKARKTGIDPDAVTDIALWTLVAGLLGARLLFVITKWSYYLEHPAALIRIWEGGLVFYGGFLSGLAVFIWQVRRKKLELWELLDLAAPSLAIAHFFGRIGCFLAGCCFGKPTDGVTWCSVVFTNPNGIAPLNIPLHPTQLYDAVNNLLLFFALEYVYRRRRFTGQIFCIYLAWYALGRIVVETFRGDDVRGFVLFPWLSTSQFIAAMMLVAALALIWRRRLSTLAR